MNRTYWLAALLLGATALSPCFAATDPLFDQFADPPATARPWVRWWWPGGAVTDEELRREITVLHDAGFGGGEIQPFKVGLPHLTPDELSKVDDYATPSFFAHVAAAADEARKQGLQIDYTFGSAWPSGGGYAITPELALGELTMATTSVVGPAPGPVKIALPPHSHKFPSAQAGLASAAQDKQVADWSARMNAREKLVAIVAVEGSAPVLGTRGFAMYPWSDVKTPGQLTPGTALVLTDKLRPDGTLDWAPPPGHWEILAFKRDVVDQSFPAAAGAGPQLALDHFSKAAFAAHAARVGDPLLSALGPSRPALRDTFVDSLEIFPDIYWSDDFLEQFRRRRGYDLTPFLPLIVQPGWMEAWTSHYSPPYYDMDDIGDRVRADYRQTVSDLMIEEFWAPFVAWNHAHHEAARFQAHGAPVDILKAYGLADVPETEDLMNSADPHFLRLARSAADLYGRSIVSAESLCWRARSYDLTPAEWRRRADLLFVSGVTQIVEHGFPYALHPEQWPDWFPFAPSAFIPGFSSFISEANPIWPAVPSLNRYIARMQSLLRAGRNDVPVALYYGEIGYYAGIDDKGANAHFPGKALFAAGYDYDAINDDALHGSHVDGHALVTPGGARFSAVVVPPLKAMSAETARRLAEFARQGLKVTFLDRAPEETNGLKDQAARDQQVKQAVADTLAHGGKTVPTADLGDRLRQAGVVPNLTFENDPVLFIEKRYGVRTTYFLHNDGVGPRHVVFRTAAQGGAERWDAWDGTRAPLPVEHDAGQGVRVALDLAEGQSALILFDPGLAPASTEPAPAVAREIAVGSLGWTLDVDGHGQQGRVMKASMLLPALEDWRALPELADFAGQGVYRRTLDIDPAALKAKRIVLDLGEVHDIAEVRLNGARLGWQIEAPFRIDISRAAKPGDNQLEITVANAAENAVIDPKKPGLKALKPMPAGLIGPVTLQEER